LRRKKKTQNLPNGEFAELHVKMRGRRGGGNELDDVSIFGMEKGTGKNGNRNGKNLGFTKVKKSVQSRVDPCGFAHNGGRTRHRGKIGGEGRARLRSYCGGDKPPNPDRGTKKRATKGES